MNNQKIIEAINKELGNTDIEKIVKTYIFNMLENFPLEHVICLTVEDNTLNGDDIEKNRWRTHFVDEVTEEDFFIEVSITPSGTFECHYFIYGDDSNLKRIK